MDITGHGQADTTRHDILKNNDRNLRNASINIMNIYYQKSSQVMLKGLVIRNVISQILMERRLWLSLESISQNLLLISQRWIILLKQHYNTTRVWDMSLKVVNTRSYPLRSSMMQVSKRTSYYFWCTCTLRNLKRHRYHDSKSERNKEKHVLSQNVIFF